MKKSEVIIIDGVRRQGIQLVESLQNPEEKALVKKALDAFNNKLSIHQIAQRSLSHAYDELETATLALDRYIRIFNEAEIKEMMED